VVGEQKGDWIWPHHKAGSPINWVTSAGLFGGNHHQSISPEGVSPTTKEAEEFNPPPRQQ
jgi:hypothetical protein